MIFMDKNPTVIIETSVDVKRVMQTYLRGTCVVSFLELVREVVEADAIPEGASDATTESERCYAAMHLLDEVLDAV